MKLRDDEIVITWWMWCNCCNNDLNNNIEIWFNRENLRNNENIWEIDYINNLDGGSTSSNDFIFSISFLFLGQLLTRHDEKKRWKKINRWRKKTLRIKRKQHEINATKIWINKQSINDWKFWINSNIIYQAGRSQTILLNF